MIAALALMGAPTTTQVACNPSPFAMRLADGNTHFSAAAPDTPVLIELSGRVCDGLRYMAALPRNRRKLARNHPDYNYVGDEGIAAVVVLHEAFHAAGGHDETAAECAAMANVSAFIAAHVPAVDRGRALVYAVTYDAGLPAAYHARPCA